MCTGINVSMIVCTHNRVTDLAETLKSIGRVEVPQGIRAELVVVDNASTDGTKELLEGTRLPGIPVRRIDEPRKGKGFAYNHGMAAARGEVFVFTDDDVHVPPDWLVGMTGRILNGSVDALAGAIRIAPHLRRPWMRPVHRKSLASTEDRNDSPRMMLVGANMAFSRRVLERVPGFDVELGPGALGLGDDDFFASQLEEAGYGLERAYDVVVEHHFQPDRLRRRSFLATAEKSGRKNAYIKHHWDHEVVARPRWNYLHSLLRLARVRCRTSARTLDEEGCSEWEIALTRRVAFYRRYFVERKRTRNYSRRGLVKLTSNA